ncbi:MAG TPA: DUF6504 family protein [Candidatus Brocadiia bacterium]|nr:DUF6504 family protein [Candidatus Brocadiia bacterium]
MPERFISEPITPAPGQGDASRVARGEPGLPHRFRWRDQEYTVEEVLETWKTTSPCRHGSGERYVAKHFYRLRAAGGAEMTLYFERRARRGSPRQWRLFSIKDL